MFSRQISNLKSHRVRLESGIVIRHVTCQQLKGGGTERNASTQFELLICNNRVDHLHKTDGQTEDILEIKQ